MHTSTLEFLSSKPSYHLYHQALFRLCERRSSSNLISIISILIFVKIRKLKSSLLQPPYRLNNIKTILSNVNRNLHKTAADRSTSLHLQVPVPWTGHHKNTEITPRAPRRAHFRISPLHRRGVSTEHTFPCNGYARGNPFPFGSR